MMFCFRIHFSRTDKILQRTIAQKKTQSIRVLNGEEKLVIIRVFMHHWMQNSAFQCIGGPPTRDVTEAACEQLLRPPCSYTIQ